MAIYRPTELFRFLKSLGISPKKGLSQNFLIDGNIIRKIVTEAKVQAGDVVVEIGPGPGCLTEALLNAGACVIAIEKDAALAAALHRLKVPGKCLEIIQADILDCPLENALKPYLDPGQKVKVIANLPYHITTPIITKILKISSVISSVVVMVQEEVAKRFIAKPCTSDYSSLTVYINYYSKARYAFKVSRRCFYPAPKVDSAVVELILGPLPAISNPASFFKMTRTAFEHRRKMLKSSLRNLYPPGAIEIALQSMGKTPKARPEELSLEDHIALFKYLSQVEINPCFEL